MIQLLSNIKIADNSGVLTGKTIKILRPKDAKIGTIGDVILIAAQKQISSSGIKNGAIFKGLIVRTKKVKKENSSTS